MQAWQKEISFRNYTWQLITRPVILMFRASPCNYHVTHPLSPPLQDRGNTPLHVAAQAGQAMQVELLVANGAHPSTLDKLGHTPEECARYDESLGRGKATVLIHHYSGPRLYLQTPFFLELHKISINIMKVRENCPI